MLVGLSVPQARTSDCKDGHLPVILPVHMSVVHAESVFSSVIKDRSDSGPLRPYECCSFSAGTHGVSVMLFQGPCITALDTAFLFLASHQLSWGSTQEVKPSFPLIS